MAPRNRSQDQNQPDIEPEDDDDPATSMVSQQHQTSRKTGRKELKRKLCLLETNYDSLAQSEAGLRSTNRELEAEVTLLKEHPNGDQSSCDEALRRKYQKRNRTQFPESQAKAIWDAGKKFAAIQRLWFPLAAWDFLSNSPEPEDDEDEDEDGSGWDPEEQAKLQAAAKELSDFLPSYLRSKKCKAAFHTQFQEGMRELRAPFVNKLAQDPARVFNIHNTRFHKKTERSNLAEVRHLLKGKQFLYEDKPPQGYLKHPCVLQALRLLLFGPSSLTDGTKSSKTRGTYDSIWGLTEVNHGLLCFVATALYFVLSGAAEFSEESDGYQFEEFYTKRRELLHSWQHSEDPTKKQEYDDLLLYFNRKLWPNHHPDDHDASRFDFEERELLAHVVGGSGSGTTGQSGGEPTVPGCHDDSQTDFDPTTMFHGELARLKDAEHAEEFRSELAALDAGETIQQNFNRAKREVNIIHDLAKVTIQQERLLRDRETATINAITRQFLGISPSAALDPAHFPITARLDQDAHYLARKHKYHDYTIQDLPDDKLTYSLDDASCEGLRHLAQSEQANKALGVALAQRDYVAVKNLAEGQNYRFCVLMALADLVRDGHYAELQRGDDEQYRLMVAHFGEEQARAVLGSGYGSAQEERKTDEALSGAT